MFHFKEFSVADDRCGMKVGVDGVLLGACAHHENPMNILDVGTGSGLIALMLAQKFPDANVHGIDLDPGAVEQARRNIQESNFTNEFKITQGNFLNQTTDLKYDLIVANLPYFNDGGHFKDTQRDLARSAKYLPAHSFLEKASKCLNTGGKIFIIYPFSENNKIKHNLTKHHLFLNKTIAIKGNSNSPPKRAVYEFSKTNTTGGSEQMVIEISRGNYTTAYQELTKDFYLNF